MSGPGTQQATLSSSGATLGWQKYYGRVIIGVKGDSSFDMTITAWFSPDGGATKFKMDTFTGLANDSTTKSLPLPTGGGYVDLEVTNYVGGSADTFIEE